MYLSEKMRSSLLIILLSCFQPIAVGQNLLKLSSGSIEFVSEAPLELIRASTSGFKAVIDTSKGSFAISIPIKSFLGFNSALQQEHFYENYMETDQFSNASFTGKILEPLTYSNMPFEITMKGQLEIHGIKKSRVVGATLEWIDRNTVQITSSFQVPLVDHDIDIPRVVYQKIAEVIQVNVNAKLSSAN